MERELLARYEGDLDRILEAIDACRLDAAAALASVPQLIRGYGHVRQASVARADAERDRLLSRLVRPEAEPIAAE
jgi:indolepyruvate ferredoxin oxidoreductase